MVKIRKIIRYLYYIDCISVKKYLNCLRKLQTMQFDGNELEKDDNNKPLEDDDNGAISWEDLLNMDEEDDLSSLIVNSDNDKKAIVKKKAISPILTFQLCQTKKFYRKIKKNLILMKLPQIM